MRKKKRNIDIRDSGGSADYDKLLQGYLDAKGVYQSLPFGSDAGVKAGVEMRDAAGALANETLLRAADTPLYPMRYANYIYRHSPIGIPGGDPVVAFRSGALRRSEDADDVAGFFSSYAKSPGFERIVGNQAKYIGDKYDENEVRDFQARLSAVNGNNILALDNMPVASSFAELSKSSSGKPIFIGTAKTPDWIEAEHGVLPYNFVLGHEFMHQMPFFNKANKKVLDSNKVKDKHDGKRGEKYSDAQGLKYLFYKEGIFDARGDKDITEDQVQQLRDKYPTMRPFQQMDNKQIMDVINLVADSGAKRALPVVGNYAKYGGLIEKYGKEGIIKALGGKIYIKPSHRGRLTELKERTDKTEAELYNDGNPAHKKMVVFARNARKWKHADGGLLRKFDTGGVIQKYGVGRIKAALAAIREMNSFNGDNQELSVTNYLENKDSLGWDAVNRRWYAPGVKGTDPKNRGMGVDINTNSSIRDGSIKLHEDSRGTYLTEDEEKTARVRSYNEAAKSAKARVNYAKSVLKSESVPSSFKMTLLRDLIYNAGSGYVAREVFDEKKNPGFMRAFIDGTDSDAYEAIQRIHRKRNRGPRANDLDSIVRFDADKNGSFVIE